MKRQGKSGAIGNPVDDSDPLGFSLLLFTKATPTKMGTGNFGFFWVILGFRFIFNEMSLI